MMNFKGLKNLFRWVNLLVIVLTLLAYLAPTISPRVFWPLSFIGLAYPGLLLANILFIIFWASLRQWYFLMSLGCILAGITHFEAFIGLHFSRLEGTEQSITIGNNNIYRLRNLAQEGKRGKDYGPLLAFFEKNGPFDILCLQESSDDISAHLATLRDFPNYHHFKGRGTAIFSRFPILQEGTIPFERSDNSCVWADLQVGARTMRVYSLHLQSNQISGEAQKLAEQGDLQEPETWKGIRGIMAKYKRAAQMRTEQAEKVVEHIQRCPFPVIVCGDLNDTPQSHVYRLFTHKAGLRDGFKIRGLGLGTTYAGAIPGLRIDYIFVSEGMLVEDYRISKKAFSDHYPLISRVAL